MAASARANGARQGEAVPFLRFQGESGVRSQGQEDFRRLRAGAGLPPRRPDRNSPRTFARPARKLPAIEQQRVPKAARDMMRGYFDKMRQQADKDLKKTDKP